MYSNLVTSPGIVGTPLSHCRLSQYKSGHPAVMVVSAGQFAECLDVVIDMLSPDRVFWRCGYL